MTQLEQIIELVKLGYSKDEITALIAQPAQQQAVVPAPATNNVDFLEALKLLGQQIAQPTVAPAQTIQQQPVAPVQTIQQQPVAPAQTIQQQPVAPAQTIQQQPVQTIQQQPVAPVQTIQQPVAPAQTIQQQPSINLTAEDLVKLTQGIAVQTAKGSIETPRSANDIILGMLDAYESTVKKEE